MSKVEIGKKFKLKSTGQRFVVVEEIKIFRLSPVAAPAFHTPNLTEQDVLDQFEPYEEGDENDRSC
ncbi:hypothetical protein SAMN05661091_4105 [Paenibacillus uliginis N3/975]|uniref:Uncharacterized protein n=1 Tax=Paenibacillus uliginis N3/975 TaxID=1313296 RepID=A0A1X7HJZ7_9BACL|nr:hypothetical protein [Paenibacillus uliginis]SMF88084.1 hypothetical protein SAMN05661091_4105 [Paenibacillus uliginis N3/975]